MTLFELLPSLKHGLNPHLDRAIWPLSAYVDDLGRLCVGDVAADDIAAEFGTPTYVVDEEDFRARIRCYRATLPDAELIYAGKALLSVDVARWAADEGAGVNVCSAGELATALAADVPPSRIVLDGVITAAELYDAVAAGVGRIVVDSPSEISLLACQVRHRQRVLVGVIPDVGVIDQKFGFALSGGQAAGALRRVLDQPWLDLVGLHCRLGSHLTDASLYGAAISQMIGVMAEVRDRHRIVLTELNLGGGHAVPYLSGDLELNLRSLGSAIDGALESACAKHEFPRPRIVIEPGRAIAARAGMTLCRVIAVKRQPGGRTFVAVDGSAGDNPGNRGAKYTVALANRHRPAVTAPVTVVGRHGDGDEIARDVELPADIHPGDLLAVARTGAYQHSTVPSHSLLGRPPLVAVSGGKCRELVRRETVADLLARDRGWDGR
ncbi:diaminopimelate decarboxylase family protein [Mycobacterium nebraskense]|uniref:diaminopimelate decarboxylase family protein n=1 Tax=Mycobacterium nebraskense TaxID=244292 RepID=UPI00061825F5|nr:diaminopimelate decarboxylase [Mycobacterium nebraskense]KKC06684.1 diaminopimelate decarboxylase [Mycobacterium nebraskense]KLO36487.1 diaminopimelate decarboxylase [Mycobacterium nebraskense]